MAIQLLVFRVIFTQTTCLKAIKCFKNKEEK